jgi:hypothetical protein
MAARPIIEAAIQLRNAGARQAAVRASRARLWVGCRASSYGGAPEAGERRDDPAAQGVGTANANSPEGTDAMASPADPRAAAMRNAGRGPRRRRAGRRPGRRSRR